jgi:hypothetical protein
MLFSIPIKDLARLLYRQIFHVSILSPSAIICSFMGIAGLILLAFTAPKAIFRELLVCIILVGFILIAILDSRYSAFAAALPSYNIWMLPVIFLFLSSGTNLAPFWRKKGSIVAVFFVFLGFFYGDYNLVNYGAYFSHGRYEEMYRKILPLYPDMEIVYPSNNYGMPYFALFYLSKGQFLQYKIVDSSSIEPRVQRLLKKGMGEILPLQELKKRYLVVIEGEDLNFKQVQNEIMGSDPPSIPPKSFIQSYFGKMSWHLRETVTFPAFRKYQVYIFEKD